MTKEEFSLLVVTCEWRGVIDNLRVQVADQQAQVANLQQQVVDRVGRILEREKQMAEQNAKIDELTRQRDEAIALLPRSIPNGFIAFGPYYAENQRIFIRNHEPMSKFRVEYLVKCEASIKEANK